VAIAAVIVLQIVLPNRLIPGPRWLVPGIEALLLCTLYVVSPPRLVGEHPRRRRVALLVTGVVSATNAVSLVLLTHYLLRHPNTATGHPLIVAGALIWLTNVLVFGLWYWEVDRGGPGTRAAGHDGPPDFLFPQMSDERLRVGWRPVFLDYLYVSLTNAAAFSPTDTLPLTPGIKSLMGLQSLVSLVTIGLVVSRAVNIL
jgi:uncharacterized membrane protein